MSNSRKRWTTTEHNTLETTINDALSRGERLSRAYRVAAFKTGRSVEACKWRWKNVIQTANSVSQAIKNNPKVAQFKVHANKQSAKQTIPQPVKVDTTSVNKLLEELFGPLMGSIPNNWLVPSFQAKSVTSMKDLDISNLSVYPMHGSSGDHIVIDEETKKAYLVAVLSSEISFCSCQTNPFENSICRHVRKLKSEKK